MSREVNGKTKMSRKNILMIVRMSLVAVVAFVMVLTACLAWFRLNTEVGGFDVRVVPGVDADVTFWKLTSMDYSEQINGQVSESALENPTRSYTQLTALTTETQATLAPGRADYFKIEIDIASDENAHIKIELLDIEWSSLVPPVDRPALQEYILVGSFQSTRPTVMQKLFVDSVVTDGKRNLTLREDATVDGQAMNKFYYYFILHEDFSSNIAGQLFSVKHVRVTIT